LVGIIGEGSRYRPFLADLRSPQAGGTKEKKTKNKKGCGALLKTPYFILNCFSKCYKYPMLHRF
jgi:hypothetical protein